LDFLRKKWPKLPGIRVGVDVEGATLGHVFIDRLDEQEFRVPIPAAFPRKGIGSDLEVTLRSEQSWRAIDVDPSVLDERNLGLALIAIGFQQPRGTNPRWDSCSARFSDNRNLTQSRNDEQSQPELPSAGTALPSVVSVTPRAGSGSAQTLRLLAMDPNGFANLRWVQLNINSKLSPLRACYVHYDRFANAVSVLDDTGLHWLGPVELRTSNEVQNSQCVVEATYSSVSGHGTDLTLNLALRFKPAFAGPKVVHMQVQNVSGAGTGWRELGAWTVLGQSTP
jgi:hypothetical protein